MKERKVVSVSMNAEEYELFKKFKDSIVNYESKYVSDSVAIKMAVEYANMVLNKRLSS